MPEILRKLFVKEDDFAPRGHLTMSGDLVVHIWEMATGISVEAKNAVKHSTVDSTVPTTKDLAQTANSYKTEAPGLEGITRPLEIRRLCRADKRKYFKAVEVHGILKLTRNWNTWNSFQ